MHLCDYPVADHSLIDKGLGEGMQTIIDCAVLGRALRNAVNIKNRQPLRKMYIAIANRPKPDQELLDVLADELNVKEIEIVESAAEFIQYTLKPQLKTLGPKYGKNLGVVREVLDTRAQDITKAVKDGGVYKTEYKGVEIELTEGDLLISVQSKEGFDSQSDDNITVVMDTKLTPELILKAMSASL